LNRTEIENRLSELRGLLAVETDEAKAAEYRTEMADLETKWREAVAAERRDDPAGDPPSVHPLASRVELRNYIAAAATGTALNGREAELNQDLRMGDGAGVRVPWEALLPTVEERADTVAPAQVGVMQQSIVARIFERTAAAHLMIEMPTVGVGETEYVILTGGTDPKMTAAGADVAGQTAATFDTTVLSPKRLTAEYVVRIEDMARLRGLEDALRSDLRMAFGVAVDRQVLAGQLSADGNTNPEQVRGLYPRFLPAAPPNAAPDAVDADAVIAFFDGKVDGHYALTRADVRTIIPSQLNAVVAGLVKSDTIDISARYGGLMQVSALIPDFVYQAKSGSNKNDGLSRYALYSLSSVPTKAVAPVWQGFDLIRDPYTQAGAGKVVITGHMLWNFDVLRAPATGVPFGVGLPVQTQART